MFQINAFLSVAGLTKSAMAGIVFAVIILSVFLIAGIVAFIK